MNTSEVDDPGRSARSHKEKWIHIQSIRLFGQDSRSDSCKIDFVGVARPNARRQEDVSSQLSSISELYVEHFNEHYKESVTSMEVSQ